MKDFLAKIILILANLFDFDDYEDEMGGYPPMKTIYKCPFCGDTWEYKGQKLKSLTNCWNCGNMYSPRKIAMLDFVIEAFRRVKGEK